MFYCVPRFASLKCIAMKHLNSLHTLEDELFSEPHKPRRLRWLKWVFALTVCGLFILRSTRPTRRLSDAPPPSFFDYNQTWSPQRRQEEKHLAEAYWHVAVLRIQRNYSPHRPLPAVPPSQFQIADATKNREFDATAARLHYWFRLREVWNQRDAWVVSYRWNTDWAYNTLNNLPQSPPHKTTDVIQGLSGFFHAVAQTILSV